MGAAHRREALDLIDVGDGHDPRQDGNLDARGPRPAQELEIAPVVEEELGDEEVRPRVHLGLAVPQVLDEVARLRMALRIAGRADAELDAVLVRDLPRAPPRGPTRAPGHADERRSQRPPGAERFEQRGHARVVLRREEFEREDRLAALRREAEHVRDPHRRRFSSDAAPLSADARRRLRRRLRRESSWPVPGDAGTTDAAATDAAQPATLHGVEHSASVKASITLPAMSFTLPLVWQPHTCTVA